MLLFANGPSWVEHNSETTEVLWSFSNFTSRLELIFLQMEILKQHKRDKNNVGCSEASDRVAFKCISSVFYSRSGRAFRMEKKFILVLVRNEKANSGK